MSMQTVRSILRIVAVVTMLVGGIGVSVSMIGAVAIQQLMQSASEGASVQHSVMSAGLFGVLSWLAVLGWGAAFYKMSPAIARLITSEPEAAGSQSKPVARESASH